MKDESPNALTPKNPATEVDLFLQSWEQRKELANTLLRSGFLPQAFKTPEQVIAVMLKGQELGIPVMEALNGINVVNGKPTVSPQLMLALVRRSRELEDIKIEHTNDACLVTIKRRGQSPHTTRFGDAEARALNLSGKENYRRQPHTMYQWRALAANLRITFPDVIGGLYTPEEMGAEVTVTDDGNQVLSSPELLGEYDETQATEQHDEPSPSVQAKGTTFDTFTPDHESITFGKYAGVLWSEVPESYLHWLRGNATRRDILTKAEATLRWREYPSGQSEQKESVVDELFPERKTGTAGPETQQAVTGKSVHYDALHTSLNDISLTNNVDDLKKWAEQHMADIESLSDEERASLRKGYKNALDRAKEKSGESSS